MQNNFFLRNDYYNTNIIHLMDNSDSEESFNYKGLFADIGINGIEEFFDNNGMLLEWNKHNYDITCNTPYNNRYCLEVYLREEKIFYNLYKGHYSHQPNDFNYAIPPKNFIGLFTDIILVIDKIAELKNA